MGRRISTNTRQELVEALGRRYLESSKREKTPNPRRVCSREWLSPQTRDSASMLSLG